MSQQNVKTATHESKETSIRKAFRAMEYPPGYEFKAGHKFMGKVMSESVAECLTRLERNIFLAGNDLAMRRMVRMKKISYVTLWPGIDLTSQEGEQMKLHKLTLNPCDSETKLKTGTVIGYRVVRYGLGVVSAINGMREYRDETPLKSHNLKSIFLDVVYETGMVSRFISLISISGEPYDVYKNCVSHRDIERLVEKSDSYRVLRVGDDASNKGEKNKANVKERTSPKWSHLEKLKDSMGAAAVAKNVRKDLRMNFGKFTFSVRKSGASSLSVEWTDGPQEAQVKTLLQKFRNGSFNCMEDYYEFSESPFHQIYGGVQYINLKRNLTDTVIEKAIEKVFAENYPDWRANLPTVDDYREGKLAGIDRDKFTFGLSHEIRKASEKL
jgi:hypothetical protein